MVRLLMVSSNVTPFLWFQAGKTFVLSPMS
jgi:hypothetical protein